MLRQGAPISSSTSSPRPRPRTGLLPPPLDAVSVHAATTPSPTTLSTTSQHAKLIVGPSNGRLGLHGPRDKRVELSDLLRRTTPSSSHTRCAGASLWPVAGGGSS